MADYNRDMDTFVPVLLGAALANNAVLMHLFGADPALRGSSRLRDALFVAAATSAVLIAATIACWIIERFVLVPFGIEWLRALVFVLVIAALAPLPGALTQRRLVIATRGLAPALLLGNGLLLGVIALNEIANGDFVAMLARVLGAAIGFGIVLLLFTAMRDRLDGADVPVPFRGAPILLITAALMALGFMGFAGIGQ